MGTNNQLSVQSNQGNQQLATISNKELLIICSPARAVEVFRKLKTLPDIFKPEHKTPSLYRLRQENGESSITAYISAWLINIAEFLNVNRGLTENQIIETASLIVENFGSLTLADVYYVFTQAKLGRYKMMYERLDGQMILNWFDNHFNERIEASETFSMREHEENKKLISNLVGEQRTSQDQKSTYKKLAQLGQTLQIIEDSNK